MGHEGRGGLLLLRREEEVGAGQGHDGSGGTQHELALACFWSLGLRAEGLAHPGSLLDDAHLLDVACHLLGLEDGTDVERVVLGGLLVVQQRLVALARGDARYADEVG